MMQTNIFCLAFAASLVVEAVAQTTVTVGIDDEDDSPSPVTTGTSNSEDPLTCGYISGNSQPVTCSPSSCALLHVSGRDNPYLGCCDDDQCNIPTTCIESGTASGRFTLACTDGSQSRCQTWTWPEISAEAYGCGTSRTTVTVKTTTRDDLATSTLSGGPTMQPTDGGPPDDDGGPGMGWEHDLDSRQRVGAGIGSAVTGGLLLIFFGIFGCWRGPARREPRPTAQGQDTEQEAVQMPGEKAITKRRATDRVAMEESNAHWPPSPLDIESPQPQRPQPPFYPTIDMPGPSMGNRNPQYQ